MTRVIKNRSRNDKKHHDAKQAKGNSRAPLFRWPNSQYEMISKIKEYGCAGDNEGVCYGMTCVAVHAMLLNQIDQFDEDLNLIKNTQGSTLQHQWSQRAFLEGVELCQQPNDYPHLFPAFSKNKNITPVQNIIASFSLIESPGIAAQGGISIAARFSGVYSQAELIHCLQCIRAGFERYPHPMALLLSDDEHVVAVQYDTDEKVWFFVDLRSLPSRPFYDESDLARALGDTLFPNLKKTVMSGLMVVTKQNQKKAMNAFSYIQNMQSWKIIHELNASKTHYLKYWLFVSAYDGCKEEVSFLLSHHVNPNHVIEKHTALDVATKQGHKEVAKLLLAHGAQVNKKKTHYSPLYYAIKHGHEHIALDLRAHGARLRPAENKEIHCDKRLSQD